jgi:Domain of unknown function (DUF397)
MTNSPLLWVKSSYSGPDGGNCVEWSPSSVAVASVVPVRDSKNADGPRLAFAPDAWSAFIAEVKAGRFPTV